MDSRTAVSSGMWLKFFTNAGIPESVSASYANKFAENRIKRDMIKDLTKDILRDMGVTCMGDIIAILRHAKEVYDEEILERVIGHSNSSSVQTATVRPTKVSSGRKSSPASRTQERHVRRSSSSAGGSSIRSTDPRESPPLSDKVKSSSHRETRSSNSISSNDKSYRKQAKSNLPEDLATYMARKRAESSSGQPDRKSESSVAVKRKLVDEVPAKRARRVLPEHEGGYKVTMPSGTTARTQEILKKKALLHEAQKKSVFERLGAGSEEDESTAAPVSDTMFRVTGLDNTPFSSASSTAKSSSVFLRLGDKSLQPTTTSSTTSGVSGQASLPYHGILKHPTKKIVLKRASLLPTSNSTMRADQEEQPANRKKITAVTPSITTVILPATKTDTRRLLPGRGCTMRADEEVCLKVVGTSPVVKRLRTSVHPPVSAPAPVDKPVMRQIFRNRTTQGILAAPVNHQKISVKARLGVGSTPTTRTGSLQFVPEKKHVVFDKREVSFMGASEKSGPSSQRPRPYYYQKSVRTDRRGPANFKNSVFHRLGRNRE